LSREYNDELEGEQREQREQRDRILQQINEQLMKEVVDEETKDISENELSLAHLESHLAREEERRRIEQEQLKQQLFVKNQMDAIERTAMVASLTTVLSPEDFQKVIALPRDEVIRYANVINTAFNDPKAKTNGVMIRKLGILVPPSYIGVKLQKDHENFKNALKQLNFTYANQYNNPSLFNQMIGQSMVSERFITKYLAEHPKVELDRRDAANLGAIRGWIAKHR